jgi:hypothetical protein
MGEQRRWLPRFGLRGLMLFVLVVAIPLTGFDYWRRAENVRAARANWERLIDHWEAGVIPTAEPIEASQNLFDAERRQWFSSVYARAILDSHILRLTRVEDWFTSPASELAMGRSEEAYAAAFKAVNELSGLIRALGSADAQTATSIRVDEVAGHFRTLQDLDRSSSADRGKKEVVRPHKEEAFPSDARH